MKRYFFLLIALVAMSSCKKWLDITPQTDVSQGDLFKTESGFEEALNGVYTRCTQSDLYGGELLVGLPEVLAQNYTLSSSNDPLKYYQSSLYNYQDADFINRKDAAWAGLYNSIANVNLILTSIDAQKKLFTGNNYSLIKGEALGLRAYLHFDALRLFGTVPKGVGSDAPQGVPYVTQYSNQITAISSPDVVIDNLVTDLKDAKQLLAGSDSIRSSAYKIGYPVDGGLIKDPNYAGVDTSTEEKNLSLFQQNRRHRLNYFAVCAELARVYLYKGDMTNALSNAVEVINANKFPWIQAKDFNNADVHLIDRIMYNELIFGWYMPAQQQYLQTIFEGGTSSQFMTTADMNALYETAGVGGEDMRPKQWFQAAGDATRSALIKYKRNTDAQDGDVTANLYPQMGPAIRKSEVYYIAAEASYDVNPGQAVAYLNAVRAARGMGVGLTITSKAQFTDELVKEVRKEDYGEGQLFYLYKRLNRNITGPGGSVVAANKKIFILPLPNSEIEFGNR